MTFKTQADIQRYLLEEEGRKVVNSAGVVAGFKNEILWDFTHHSEFRMMPDVIANWRPYQEPRQWHETAEPGTGLCWFWDAGKSIGAVRKNRGSIALYKRIEIREGRAWFIDDNDTMWPNCRPLTPAEIEPFLEVARRIAENNGDKK